MGVTVALLVWGKLLVQVRELLQFGYNGNEMVKMARMSLTPREHVKHGNKLSKTITLPKNYTYRDVVPEMHLDGNCFPLS
jgi:hypothetical protein